MEDDWGVGLIKDDCLFSCHSLSAEAPMTPDLMSSPLGSNDLMFFPPDDGFDRDDLIPLDIMKTEVDPLLSSSSTSPPLILPNFDHLSNPSCSGHVKKTDSSEDIKMEPADEQTEDGTLDFGRYEPLTSSGPTSSGPSSRSSAEGSDVSEGSNSKPPPLTYYPVQWKNPNVITSNGATSNRPTRLLITRPGSQITQTLVLPRRKRFIDHHSDISPSPPSSERSSPSDVQNMVTPCLGPRSRSKMQELAVMHRLISDQDPRGSGSVHLSGEERKTLIQEGYPVPSRLPLTKSEEEALKIVRRKIKNKLSAQESRKKRKDYMETLEHRVHNYHGENASLRQRVKQLEQSNRGLMSQLRKLQNLVGKNVPNVTSATQTSVSLTALVLLFAVFIPTFPTGWPRQLSVWQPIDSIVDEPIPSFDDHVSKGSRILSTCDLPYSANYFEERLDDVNEEVERADHVHIEQQELFVASQPSLFTFEEGNRSVWAPNSCVNGIACSA